MESPLLLQQEEVCNLCSLHVSEVLEEIAEYVVCIFTFKVVPDESHEE